MNHQSSLDSSASPGADGPPGDDDGGYAALWDWRRQVNALYAAVRGEPDPVAAWHLWKARRNELFAHHSQSPIEPAVRKDFGDLDYFPYDAALRFAVRLDAIEAAPVGFAAGHDGDLQMRPFARTRGLASRLG